MMWRWDHACASIHGQIYGRGLDSANRWDGWGRRAGMSRRCQCWRRMRGVNSNMQMVTYEEWAYIIHLRNTLKPQDMTKPPKPSSASPTAPHPFHHSPPVSKYHSLSPPSISIPISPSSSRSSVKCLPEACLEGRYLLRGAIIKSSPK